MKEKHTFYQIVRSKPLVQEEKHCVELVLHTIWWNLLYDNTAKHLTKVSF